MIEIIPVSQARSQTEAHSILERIQSHPLVMPFEEETVDAIASMGRSVGAIAGSNPDLHALAFWLRSGALKKMKEDLYKTNDSKEILVPRGNIFHLPPSNVDTLFLYSLVLALLMGNRCIVRISQRSVETVSPLVRAMNDALKDFPAVAGKIALVSYGHSETETLTFSAWSDLRVIWGGDQTVELLRSFPIKPGARDVVFPDRTSIAVIHSRAYLATTTDQKKALAKNFFTDLFSFDQMGCSSPRALYFCDSTDQKEVEGVFFGYLLKVIQSENYQSPDGLSVAKLAYSYQGVINDSIESIERISGELTVLRGGKRSESNYPFCGGGVLHTLHINKLDDLNGQVSRRDQTMTHFGFERDELIRLVHTLRGQGIDRIVPIGQALAFNKTWDGMDLLREFSRQVSIVGAQ